MERVNRIARCAAAPHLARGRRMRTYEAGKEPLAAAAADTRDWVFDLLENPRYRERLEVLAGSRWPGARAASRACARSSWTTGTTRRSTTSAGASRAARRASRSAWTRPLPRPSARSTAATRSTSCWRRRVAIAAPLAGSHLINGGGGGRPGRAGRRQPDDGPGDDRRRTTPATTPGTTTPATTPATTTPGETTPAATTPVVTPVRARSTSGRARQAGSADT